MRCKNLGLPLYPGHPVTPSLSIHSLVSSFDLSQHPVVIRPSVECICDAKFTDDLSNQEVFRELRNGNTSDRLNSF